MMMLEAMRGLFWLISAALCLILAGCIPYPVYKTLQPEATLTVLDESSSPVVGAEVQLVANAYPYGWERSREIRMTEADGVARFESHRQWRVESLMLHGFQVFFWNWCVRRDGYASFFTAYGDASEFKNVLTVQLVPGVSTRCPEAFR